MSKDSTQERILLAAIDILEAQGIEGLTTRAVCEATGVTAPTLYHHFTNKEGLVAAVIRHGVHEFLARKRDLPLTDDPVADLRRGWDGWIGFAHARPRLFRLMTQMAGADGAATGEAYAIMQRLVERIAQAGRLETDTETAARAIWAASNGVLMSFLQGGEPADLRHTADLMFDGLILRLVRSSQTKRP
jgi:AcrR family transcriptional regulator